VSKEGRQNGRRGRDKDVGAVERGRGRGWERWDPKFGENACLTEYNLLMHENNWKILRANRTLMPRVCLRRRRVKETKGKCVQKKSTPEEKAGRTGVAGENDAESKVRRINRQKTELIEE